MSKIKVPLCLQHFVKVPCLQLLGIYASTSFPQRADHNGPHLTYGATSARSRWRPGFTEFEAFSSCLRPITISDSSTSNTRARNSDSGLRTLFHVDHNANRLLEHFVTGGDPFNPRMGYVSTRLPDDGISKCLKETAYNNSSESQDERKNMRRETKWWHLKCTRQFHTTCIKSWLQMKNTCPVCKSEAFEDTKFNSVGKPIYRCLISSLH